MKFLVPLALLALAACATEEPVGLIQSGETFAKSRVVLVKGRIGGSAPSQPYLQRRSYTVTCAADNQGGTPAQRADAMMAALPAAVGQVYIAIGPQYALSSDMQAINKFAVPRYRCSVAYPDFRREATGDAAITAWALENGAMQELIDER